MGRYDEGAVGELLQTPTPLPQQGDDFHPLDPRRLSGAQGIGTLPAGRVQDEHVSGARHRLDLPREDLVESQIVGTGGEEGRVCGQGDRREGTAGATVYGVVVPGEVRGVGCALTLVRPRQ